MDVGTIKKVIKTIEIYLSDAGEVFNGVDINEKILDLLVNDLYKAIHYDDIDENSREEVK